MKGLRVYSMKRVLKWYIVFVLCVVSIAMPIEYMEFLKFGSEIEPFSLDLVFLWTVIASIMYWSIFLLRKRPFIWIAIITTFGFIFEFFINPHQEAPLAAAIFAWFLLFGVCPMAAIWMIRNKKMVKEKLFSNRKRFFS